MAGVRIEGDIGPLKQMINRLSNLDKRGINKVIAEALRTSTIERFEKEKTPEGKRWKSSIRASSEGGKTLSKSGLLKTSIKDESSEAGVAIGTNSIYAATHQFGDSRTIKARGKVLRFKVGGFWRSAKVVKVNIPKREFLGISEDDMAEIKATLNDFIGGDR